MNAVKCSVMTGQHDGSFILHTVELLNAHNRDNIDRKTLKINAVMTAIFFYLCLLLHTHIRYILNAERNHCIESRRKKC